MKEKIEREIKQRRSQDHISKQDQKILDQLETHKERLFKAIKATHDKRNGLVDEISHKLTT